MWFLYLVGVCVYGGCVCLVCGVAVGVCVCVRGVCVVGVCVVCVCDVCDL